MKRPLVALLTVLLIGLAGWSSLPGRVSAMQVTPTPRADREARLIAELNDCLQERFKDVDEGFGFRRIARIDETPHRFKPENLRELAAVHGLERERLRLVLYLTGRRVLRANAETGSAIVGSMWTLIKGPVLVTSAESVPVGTGNVTGDAPPQAQKLLEESRRAMAAFAQAESYDFVVDQWKFIARPVRASDTMCLSCHREAHTTLMSTQNPSGTPLRIGDALGVLLYGYQPVR
jgi:hypothetical protein